MHAQECVVDALSDKRVGGRSFGATCCREFGALEKGVAADQADFPYDHILIALTDSHRALTSTSRQTMELAVGLASPRRSKLTVMFIEEQGSMPPTDCIASIQSEFADRLLGELSFVEEAVGYAEGRGAVALGEVADTLSADLVVLSTQAVRQHCLDANLLAEFVPCPLLLLP
ncbi:hypothetical protein H632_c2457p0 [Helicosporidium sp. ATCC 50920]|nr:hypothetical protein H632_c2457p0 [Helicosporidium sp. ATCC 50920]|eukprot:KDD73176.1 hypothetical protein H632_c2457p0 [Helicosporidium sp. ATCC 50920]